MITILIAGEFFFIGVMAGILLAGNADADNQPDHGDLEDLWK